ncbi:MAG: hypothetical protein HYU75_24810 [Betaproteobacteria bacterium]|nr:hypothetical protein [Betaproteobacteria bacterium]
MNQDRHAPDWIQAYLEWSDQSHAQNRPSTGGEGDSAAQTSEQFVSAYLEWIDAVVLEVRADSKVNTRKLARHRRKVGGEVLLEQSAKPSLPPQPVTGTHIRPA